MKSDMLAAFFTVFYQLYNLLHTDRVRVSYFVFIKRPDDICLANSDLGHFVVVYNGVRSFEIVRDVT